MPTAKTSKKSTATIKQEPTPTPAPAPTPSVPVEVAPDADQTDAWEERFKLIDTSIKLIINSTKGIQVELKKLQRDFSRQTKELNRRKSRKAKKDRPPGDRPLSGFARPTEISNDLAKFFGEKKGTLLARTEVTKKITEYIKKNDLQNPENRRQILADAALTKLLACAGATEVLTFFNLQRYLKPHFIKQTGESK